jgi:hypothetical protein
MEILERFIDEEGKIKQLPSKKDARLVVLAYLASKFEAGRDYREKEVNAIIDGWHTFGDYFLLRRELIDSGLMKREQDGSRYWKDKQAEE